MTRMLRVLPATALVALLVRDGGVDHDGRGHDGGALGDLVPVERQPVFGFFEEILEKISNEELAEYHRELVHQKFENA